MVAIPINIERGSKYNVLADLLESYNCLKVDEHKSSKVSYNSYDEDSYTDIDVNSWAHGPLLKIQQYNRGGGHVTPCIPNEMIMWVVAAGYVPWGFRHGMGDPNGQYSWYLRPIEHIEKIQEESTKYALKDEGGHYVRDNDGCLVTFDSKDRAFSVADNTSDLFIEEIHGYT